MLFFVAICLSVFVAPVLILGSAAIFNSDEWISIDLSVKENALPSPIIYTNQESKGEIFILIASFRDSRCATTLRNIFTKAQYPNRIRVGLVEQIDSEKDPVDCISSFCQGKSDCPHKSQIDLLTFSSQDARGPNFARSFESGLLGSEEFCLQIDSHTDFVKDWDTKMITMWQSIGNEYAILSAIPPDLKGLGINVHDNFEVPHVCESVFTKYGMVEHLLPRSAMNLDRPILTSYWSAAFSFSKCHAEAKVPFDPNYLYLTSGGEFAKYARLWTRGYDVYTPNRILIAHDDLNSMKKEGATEVDPHLWVKAGMRDLYRWSMYEAAVARVKTLLGYSTGADASKVSALTHFGLGLARSLDQFIEFTGIDVRRQTVFADKCAQLSWVPFSPDSNPEIDSSSVWGMHGEFLKANGPNIPLESGKVAFVSFSDSKAMEPGNFIESKSLIRKTENLIESASASSKAELWYIFQTVDNSVESIVELVDQEIGLGHGIKNIKLILLLTPLFLLILYAAVVTLTGSTGTRNFIRNDAKRI